MQIPVRSEICLTEFRCSDKADCVRRINDREIADCTLRIPHPYLESDFERWFEGLERLTAKFEETVYFAIREGDSLIGGIGFDNLVKGHRAEIGYWLARPYWGRGIMTDVVQTVCAYAINKWQLVRITAHVFLFNRASARVLEKSGFEVEGILRKHHQKGGEFLDSSLYALVK